MSQILNPQEEAALWEDVVALRTRLRVFQTTLVSQRISPNLQFHLGDALYQLNELVAAWKWRLDANPGKADVSG